MKRLFAIVVGLSVQPAFAGDAVGKERTKKVRGEHVTVAYRGVDKQWAQGFAALFDAVYEVYDEQLKITLPEVTRVDLILVPDQPTRLWTDPQGEIHLHLNDLSHLEPTGRFQNVYGMCHEAAHVAAEDGTEAMGTLVEDWAHYAASLCVDRLWNTVGAGVYPLPHDYSDTGLRRLTWQCMARPTSVCTLYILGEQGGHDMLSAAVLQALAEPGGSYPEVLDHLRANQ